MKTFYSKLTPGLLAILLIFAGGLLAQPANDDLCDAISLVVNAGCSGLPNGDNTGATFQIGEPNPSCFSGAVNSVWYSFVGPASGLVKISTNYSIGSNTDTEIAMYALNSGQCSNPSDLSLIACQQDDFLPPQLFNSTINQAPVIPGETYYVAVSGWNGNQGSFCLTVDELPSPVPAPPANDTLCNAIALQVDSSCNGMTNGTNLNAFFEVGEPLPTCSGASNTVWYSFVAPPAGAVEITTDVNVGGTNTQSSVSLYALPGAACTNLSDLFEVACASGNGSNGSSIDTTRVTPGQTYYIAVSGGSGTFCVEVSSAPGIAYPANDNLCDAIPLGVGAPCPGNFDNTNATLEIGEPTPGCFVGTANSVWFSFVGPGTGAASITTDIDSMGSNDDTEIAIYSLPGGNCANLSDLVLLECSQDNGAVFPFNGFIEGVPVTPGETYYVQVSGYNGTEGTFCISVEQEFVSQNDDVCDAINLPVDGIPRDFFNLSATLEAGEDTLVVIPTGDGAGRFAWYESMLRTTTWHTFVAPASGAVRIDLCNGGNGTTDFDTQVAVFGADSCNGFAGFTLIGANDDDSTGCTTNANRYASVLDVSCLQPGETYYVVVDGYQNQSGLYSIAISELTVAPMQLTFDATGPTCAGDQDGLARVQVNGGAFPFTYSWDNGDSTPLADSLGLGTYSVTVTDLCGAMTSSSVTLEAQPSLVANAFTDDVLCAGDSSGQAFLVVGGGRSPYTYSWDTGDTSAFVTGLKAGTYLVTVTDICDTSRTASIQIIEPSGLEAFAGEDQFVCDTPASSVALGGSPVATGGSFQPETPRAYGFDLNASLGLFNHQVNRTESISTLVSSVDTFTAGDFVGSSFYLVGLDSANGALYRYDLDSARVEKIGRFPTAPEQLWVGLAYDLTRSKLFGLRTGSRGSFLFEINPADAQVDSVGELNMDVPIWLAINGEGEMYSLDIVSDEIVGVDTSNLDVMSMGSIGFDANFLQDADFDPETGLLYLAAYNDDSGRAEYRVIDLELGTNSTLIDTFAQPTEVSAYGIAPKGSPVGLYTYQWEPAIGLSDPSLATPAWTYVMDTTYVLTVMDVCGNVAVDSLKVSLNDDLSVDSVATENGTTRAFVGGGIAPYSYSWSNGASTATVQNLEEGSYSLTVTDSVGCTATLNFEISVSVERAWNFGSLSLYPNPNGGKFVLEYELNRSEEVRLDIYGMDGKLVYNRDLGAGLNIREKIDLGSLPDGVYKLVLSSENSFVSRSFLIR